MHVKVPLSKTKYRTPNCSWWAGWHVARQPSPSACEWTICRLDKRCSRSTAQQQQSFFCRFWSFQNSLLKVLLCIRHWNMNLHWLWCETSNFCHWYQWFNIFLCNYCSEVFFCFVLFSSVETLQTNFFSSLFSFFFFSDPSCRIAFTGPCTVWRTDDSFCTENQETKTPTSFSIMLNEDNVSVISYKSFFHLLVPCKSESWILVSWQPLPNFEECVSFCEILGMTLFSVFFICSLALEDAGSSVVYSSEYNLIEEGFFLFFFKADSVDAELELQQRRMGQVQWGNSVGSLETQRNHTDRIKYS